MKILLKSRATGRYLGRGGSWIDQPEAALAFLDEMRAKDHSIYRGLTDTQVVVLDEAATVNVAPAAALTKEKANMVVKTKINRTSRTSRTGKHPKPKVGRLSAIENTLLAHQVSEVTRKPARVNPTPPGRQISREAVAPESRTIIQANVDVGFGNALFIRGEGNGLSWDNGQPLTCIDPNWWHWSTTSAREKVVFKLLLNDKVWAKGENVEVDPGKTTKVAPEFP